MFNRHLLFLSSPLLAESMKGKTMKIRFVAGLVVCLLLTGIIPVMAQAAPAITVAPIWMSSTILASENSNGGAFPSFDDDDCYDPVTPGCGPGDTTFDDDVQYVDTEIWVTSSVNFWAVQMTCTVNKTLLEGYTQDLGDDGIFGNGDEWTPDYRDDMPMVWLDDSWDGRSHMIEQPFNASTGTFGFTATLLGNTPPLGSNGTNFTFPMARIKFRVRPSAVAGTSPLACTSSFLDRDGKPVVTPVYKAPPPLNIIPGYIISGNVKYQARASHANIGVNCTNQDTGLSRTAKTDAAGNFKVTTRSRGWYECLFFGNIIDVNPDVEQSDLYLRTFLGTHLQNVNSYTFLPITMPSGNAAITTADDCDPGTPGIQFCPDEQISMDDLNIVTDAANWNKTGTTPARGDVNGDGKTDKSDLVIVGANFGESENYYYEHLIYSLPRDYAQFQNSKTWVGRQELNYVTPLITPAANTRDLWAALSPDGSKIAFVRSDAPVNGVSRYGLWIVNADGKTGLKRLTPPKWNDIVPCDAFAPSWSPDGSKIAFICSWYGSGASGIRGDEGYISLVDTNGNNLQVLNYALSRIFPPAWFSDIQMFYGAPDHAGFSCTNGLCNLDYRRDQSRPVANVPAGADMPRMSDGRLVYRYNGGLRFAEVDQNCTDHFSGCEAVKGYTAFPPDVAGTVKPAFVHTDVYYEDGGNYYPVTNAADFLELSPDHRGVGILFYETGGNQFSLLHMNNGAYEWGAQDSGGQYPYWTNPNDNWQRVPNMVGNLDPTDYWYYALRNAIDWTY